MVATSEPSKEIINRVKEMAKKKQISMAQVAIAWSLTKDGVTAPVVGSADTANLKDLLGVLTYDTCPLGFLLSDSTSYCEEPHKPLPIFGHASSINRSL